MLTPAPCSKLPKALLWLSIKSNSLAWNSRPPTIWLQTSLYLPPVNSLFLQTSPWDVQSYCRNGPPVWKGGQYHLSILWKRGLQSVQRYSGALEALPGGARQELLQRHGSEILLPFPFFLGLRMCLGISPFPPASSQPSSLFAEDHLLPYSESDYGAISQSQGREQLKTLALEKLL